jgi:hypothetical protein
MAGRSKISCARQQSMQNRLHGGFCFHPMSLLEERNGPLANWIANLISQEKAICLYRDIQL